LETGGGGGEGDKSDGKNQGCQGKSLEERDELGHIFSPYVFGFDDCIVGLSSNRHMARM
jgi:hypothetical protein